MEKDKQPEQLNEIKQQQQQQIPDPKLRFFCWFC